MAIDNGPKRDVTPEKNTFDKKDKGESFNKAANPWNNPGKTGGAHDDNYQCGFEYNTGHEWPGFSDGDED